MVVNLITGQKYVGSAILGRMQTRFHKHLFAGSGNKLLRNAVAKYGLANFAFLVIDQIQNFTSEDNQRLLSLETSYITKYGDYNIAREAGNTMGVLHSREQRAAMCANYSQRRRDKIGSLNRNQKLSVETVERMRIAALKRRSMSRETRLKVSANSAKAMLYELVMLDNSPIAKEGGSDVMSLTLRTIPVVATFCGCGEKTVRRALKGNGIIKGKRFIKPLGQASELLKDTSS